MMIFSPENLQRRLIESIRRCYYFKAQLFNTAMRILFLFLSMLVILDAPAQDSKQKLVVFLDITVREPTDLNSPLTVDEQTIARKLKTEFRSYASADYNLLFYSKDEKENAAEMLQKSMSTVLETGNGILFFQGIYVIVSAFTYPTGGYLGVNYAGTALHTNGELIHSSRGSDIMFTSPDIDGIVSMVANKFSHLIDIWSE